MLDNEQTQNCLCINNIKYTCIYRLYKGGIIVWVLNAYDVMW